MPLCGLCEKKFRAKPVPHFSGRRKGRKVINPKAIRYNIHESFLSLPFFRSTRSDLDMKYLFACLLLLLPLLYIGVSPNHDWGDDFAQYLIQARNVVEGKPQTANGLVFDQKSGDFALRAYPLGFPLLLVPIYLVSGLSVKPYLLALSVSLIFLGLLLFEFFRKKIGDVCAILLALLFCYHTFSLEMKEQILSEIPFTLFLFILFYLRTKENAKSNMVMTLLTGALIGWIASVRIIGWVALAALVLSEFTEKEVQDADETRSSKLKRLTLLSGSAVLLFVLVNYVFLRIPIGGFFGFYSKALGDHANPVVANYELYRAIAGFMFKYPFFSGALPTAWLLLSLVSWAVTFFRHRRIQEWFFLIYVVTLLFYPYQSGGFRFVFPVFPLLLYYFISALLSLKRFVPEKGLRVIVILFLGFLLYGYSEGWKAHLWQQHEIVEGPQRDVSRQLFSYLDEYTQPSDLLVFLKPRALVLYAKRPSTYLVAGQTPPQTDAVFQRLGVRYLILPKAVEGDELYDRKMVNYFEQYSSSYTIKWENGSFKVFERNPKKPTSGASEKSS